MLKITLKRSPIGNKENHKRTVRALGLRKLNHSVIQPDNESVRGMIFAVKHLVEVETVDKESKDATA
ncbi:MAG: 50S ribosomal protein L30 [Armatimonadetes bacterium]|nr:50S ribosomal protein L30 [Armatimonadota bacterium]